MKTAREPRIDNKNDHLRAIRRGADKIINSRETLPCKCFRPDDPNSDECPACRAWLDMAERVNEAVEKYEQRITGDDHGDS